jgi:chromosome segregation ATPase
MATKEQIWAAADAISAEGGNPTLAAVRAHMGGGSYTDISAAMQSWRATQQASSTPIREPAPPAITDQLNALGSELWAAALELANNRLQSERECLELARQEAEETRKEAAALADALAADLDKAQAENAALREQLAASIAKQEQQQVIINQETAAAIESKHRVELAEVARAELKTRADQLSELLKEAQATSLAEQGRHQADIERVKAEATATAQQLTQAQKEAENARVAEQSCQARLESAAREIESLKAQVKEERNAAKVSAETAAELKGRLSALDVQKPTATKKEKVTKSTTTTAT